MTCALTKGVKHPSYLILRLNAMQGANDEIGPNTHIFCTTRYSCLTLPSMCAYVRLQY
mgnify:CR=1 FL=1